MYHETGLSGFWVTSLIIFHKDGSYSRINLKFSEKYYFELFRDWGPCQTENSPLIYTANKWNGFYMIGTSVMEELNTCTLYISRSKLPNTCKPMGMFQITLCCAYTSAYKIDSTPNFVSPWGSITTNFSIHSFLRLIPVRRLVLGEIVQRGKSREISLRLLRRHAFKNIKCMKN